MKRITAFAVALASFTQIASAELGVRSFTFNAPHRPKPVEAVVWYPGDGGAPTLIGDNPVFEGTRALENANVKPGKHPLIVLSHGSGGNAANLGWIAAKLVDAGFVVVAPNHPGSTSGDSRPETNVKAWERPQDVSALISAMTATDDFGVDQTKIGVLGFSIGGHTALALAGARIRIADYATYCDRNITAPDCQWFERGNRMIPGHVDLHKVDAAAADADYRDARIKLAVAVDPALAEAYQTESLTRIAVPIQVVNLGSGNAVPLGIRGEKIAAFIPGALHETVADARHFSFLGLCKPEAAKILDEEGDDPICDGENIRSRAELHDDIARRIVSFLKTKL